MSSTSGGPRASACAHPTTTTTTTAAVATQDVEVQEDLFVDPMLGELVRGYDTRW
jgi:hypothetical protein